MTAITSVNNMPYQQQQQKPSRLKTGTLFALGSAVVSGGILLGDTYCPNATHKVISILNFSKPSKTVEPVFKKFSTKSKVITVAALSLLSGVLGAIMCSPDKTVEA